MKGLAWVAMTALVLGLATSWGWANVEYSKHDFRAVRPKESSPTDRREVCTFCHTPRNDDADVTRPLWNPAAVGTDFRRFASLATANLEENRDAVGSVSLACLSCHDGTQAIDVSLNNRRPSGPVAAMTLPPAWAGGAEAAGWRFAPKRTTVRVEHPVNISYAGGACQGLRKDCDPGAVAGGNPDFHLARFEVINSTASWWVDSAVGVPGQREKTDMILYARRDGDTVGPSVECGSCHDPHQGQAQPVSFLRLDAADSTLCLTCHIK